MKYILDIQLSAEEGALEGFSYYEEKQEGLGTRFLDQLDGQLKQLQKDPTIYQKKHKNIRTVLIKPFPYHIVYEIDNIKIVVYKVIYAGRQSKKRYSKE